MGVFNALVKLSCIIALVAVLLAVCPQHDALAPVQKRLLAYVDIVKTLAKTFPLHWFNSEKVTQNIDKLTGVYNKVVRDSEGDRIFTKEELAKYDGTEGSLGLCLGILGLVYDVSEGERFYGPGNGYGFFSGRDGTKAFMSGEFNEKGLVDEVTGLSPGQMLELERWIIFYDDTYIYKGKVVGNFYDDQGRPTAALRAAVDGIYEGHDEENKINALKQVFPHCNSQFKKDVGGRIWCSENSGGEKRNWVGVPRKFYMPGSTKPRCACVRDTGPPSNHPDSASNHGDLQHPGLEVYESCDPLSASCALPVK